MQGKHDEYQTRIKMVMDVVARFRARDLAQQKAAKKAQGNHPKTDMPVGVEIKEGQEEDGEYKRRKGDQEMSKTGGEGKDGDDDEWLEV